MSNIEVKLLAIIFAQWQILRFKTIQALLKLTQVSLDLSVDIHHIIIDVIDDNILRLIGVHHMDKHCPTTKEWFIVCFKGRWHERCIMFQYTSLTTCPDE